MWLLVCVFWRHILATGSGAKFAMGHFKHTHPRTWCAQRCEVLFITACSFNFWIKPSLEGHTLLFVRSVEFKNFGPCGLSCNFPGSEKQTEDHSFTACTQHSVLLSENLNWGHPANIPKGWWHRKHQIDLLWATHVEQVNKQIPVTLYLTKGKLLLLVCVRQ